MESIKSSISSLFTKSNEPVLDNFTITISKVNPSTKTKEPVSEGHGSWLGQIYIDGKKLVLN